MCPGDWPFPGPSPPVTRFSLCPAQHDGQPYCHKPCYGILFGPKGECLPAHGVGSRSGGTHPTRAAALDAHAIAQRGHLPGACHLPARVLTLLHLPPPPMQESTPELWEATSTTKTPRRRTSPRWRRPPARSPALCPRTNLLLAAGADPHQAGHGAVLSLLSLLRAGWPCPPDYIS